VITAVTGVDKRLTFSPYRRPKGFSIAPSQFFCRRDSLKLFSGLINKRNSNVVVDLLALRQIMLFWCCFIVVGTITCRLSGAADEWLLGGLVVVVASPVVTMVIFLLR
jgi:hypothetical protein